MQYTTGTGPYLSCLLLGLRVRTLGATTILSWDWSTSGALRWNCNCASWSVAGVSHREPIWGKVAT